MKKQKHFITDQSICRAIDAAKDKVKEHLANAELKEDEGRKLVRDCANNPDLVESGKMLIEEGRKLRDSAARIESSKLPKLQRTLAAFRTETLPGVVDNRDVVLQGLK